MHHTSAAWLIVGITTGLFVPMTRAIMAVSLPLVGQHLGVLVKYHNLGLYVLINLFLEIWWEWELFQQQQELTRARGYHMSPSTAAPSRCSSRTGSTGVPPFLRSQS